MSTLSNYNPTPTSSGTYYGVSTIYGVASGVLMGIYLLLTGDYITGFQPAIALSKYIILGIGLAFFIRWYRSVTPSDTKVFRGGMKYGLFTSVIAAATLSIFSLIASSIYRTDTTGNFFLNDGTGPLHSSATLAGVTFFECFVAGLILTFIWLQLFKGDTPVDHA